jgi:integrase
MVALRVGATRDFMALTTKGIARLRKKPGRYLDQFGLLLQVINDNNASWILRYQRDGKQRMLGLGPVHTVSLAEARVKARNARLALLEGIDPLDARRARKAADRLEAAKAMTFAAAAQSYFAQHEAKWKNRKHAAQFLSTLRTYVYPVIGGLSVAAIDTGLVLRVLEQPVDAERGYPAGPFWAVRPETASRVRGRIETVLDWATARGLRTGDNPASWKTVGKALPPRGQVAAVEHHPALPFAEINPFMVDLRKREGIAARALEFTILTAARTSEVIGARWDEIDFSAATWTIPAGRMKAGKAHRVPLSGRAVAVLKSLYTERDSPFVFLGATKGASLSNMAMAIVLKRMGRDNITVHGFRSTFRDWAAETTSYPNDVIEMALAHTVGNKVEAAYRRGDLFEKRKRLMDEWAAFCARAPAKAGDTVVPLRRRAK